MPTPSRPHADDLPDLDKMLADIDGPIRAGHTERTLLSVARRTVRHLVSLDARLAAVEAREQSDPRDAEIAALRAQLAGLVPAHDKALADLAVLKAEHERLKAAHEKRGMELGEARGELERWRTATERSTPDAAKVWFDRAERIAGEIGKERDRLKADLARLTKPGPASEHDLCVLHPHAAKSKASAGVMVSAADVAWVRAVYALGLAHGRAEQATPTPASGPTDEEIAASMWGAVDANLRPINPALRFDALDPAHQRALTAAITTVVRPLLAAARTERDALRTQVDESDGVIEAMQLRDAAESRAQRLAAEVESRVADYRRLDKTLTEQGDKLTAAIARAQRAEQELAAIGNIVEGREGESSPLRAVERLCAEVNRYRERPDPKVAAVVEAARSWLAAPRGSDRGETFRLRMAMARLDSSVATEEVPVRCCDLRPDCMHEVLRDAAPPPERAERPNPGAVAFARAFDRPVDTAPATQPAPVPPPVHTFGREAGEVRRAPVTPGDIGLTADEVRAVFLDGAKDGPNRDTFGAIAVAGWAFDRGVDHARLTAPAVDAVALAQAIAGIIDTAGSGSRKPSPSEVGAALLKIGIRLAGDEQPSALATVGAGLTVAPGVWSESDPAQSFATMGRLTLQATDGAWSITAPDVDGSMALLASQLVGKRGSREANKAAAVAFAASINGATIAPPAVPEAEPPAEPREVVTVEDERAWLIRIQCYTKHGPGGKGGPGDCDPKCVKCEAQQRQAALAGSVIAAGGG